jgi:hypothetical protein
MGANSMSQEDGKSSLFKNSAITVTIIGGIFTLTGVLLGVFIPWVINRPSPLPACSMCVIGEIFSYSQFVKGEFWTWENTPGTLTTDFTENCANTSFHGIHIIYDFSGEGNGGLGVQWGKLQQGFDASGFTTLTFWVRGVIGNEKFEVGLKDKNGTETKIQFAADSVGRNTIIGLNKFTSVNLSSLENLNFSFNKTHGSGNICIDDIVFN